LRTYLPFGACVHIYLLELAYIFTFWSLSTYLPFGACVHIYLLVWFCDVQKEGGNTTRWRMVMSKNKRSSAKIKVLGQRWGRRSESAACFCSDRTGNMLGILQGTFGAFLWLTHVSSFDLRLAQICDAIFPHRRILVSALSHWLSLSHYLAARIVLIL